MARRITSFGRPRTIATASVNDVLSFDNHRALFRQLPLALIVGLLGLLMLSVRGDGILGSLILIAAGFGYAGYILWLRSSPAGPTLVLSPEGIRYRAAGDYAVDIPWDEVQEVDSADIYVRFGRSGSMERGVPVMMVSDEFYQSHIHIDSLWQRGPGWQYVFIPKDGLVQVAIFHSPLSQSGIELRTAIEKRWRAFSNNPNTQLPPKPMPAPARPWLTSRQKLAAAAAAAVIALPMLWYWSWIDGRLAPDMPAGSSGFYLERLLDAEGVPARREDGVMVMVHRPGIRQIVSKRCHKRIVRDDTARSLMPVYDIRHDCVADLLLGSGMSAVAAFRLVVEGGHWTTTPLGLEEAERQICALRPCK